MAIVYQKDAGLGQGITALGQALSQGLSQYGQSQYQTALQKATEERDRQKNISYGTAVSEAFEGLTQDSSEIEWASAFTNAMKSGVPVDVVKSFAETMKAIKPSKDSINPADKINYNNNIKLFSGISSDAKKSAALLTEAEPLLKAIKSGNLPGRGVLGDISEKWNELFNSSPKEVQLLKTLAKRTLIDMGDTKGMRLTDAKLRLLEDNLFNPRKSPQENEEAFRLWYDSLNRYQLYNQVAKELYNNNPNILYDPLFEDTIMTYVESIIDSSSDSGLNENNKSSQEQMVVDKLPPASQVKKGKKATNTETGEVYIFNGKRWVKQ